VLSNGHAGFGGRVRETGRSKYRHRALIRPYPSGSTTAGGGKPTVRKAQLLGGNRMPKKRMPAAERKREGGEHDDRILQPGRFSYNRPDTGPGARL
jgi:hypothetical protein